MMVKSMAYFAGLKEMNVVKPDGTAIFILADVI